MLIREKNPRVMIKIGYVLLIVFFVMNYLPHPTSGFGDGMYDGVRGAMLGVGGTLLLWATYINGQRRRSRVLPKD